jgi:hypothetical protein
MPRQTVGTARKASTVTQRISATVLILAVFVAILALYSPVAAAAADARQSFFHSIEFRSNKTQAFHKWISALDRTAREQDRARDRDCGDDTPIECAD